MQELNRATEISVTERLIAGLAKAQKSEYTKTDNPKITEERTTVSIQSVRYLYLGLYTAFNGHSTVSVLHYHALDIHSTRNRTTALNQVTRNHINNHSKLEH